MGRARQYITRVDLYKFLCKWELRSYPDDRGRPLFDPAARLSPGTLANNSGWRLQRTAEEAAYGAELGFSLLELGCFVRP